MELNSVGSVNAYSEISGISYNRHVQGDNESPPFLGNGEDMDISGPGRIMNAISQMSEKEKSEMKAFNEGNEGEILSGLLLSDYTGATEQS